ncbi:hypothetical protein [Nodularia sp. NIES-3585]|uniref:hypothetical protein n=1 Tax=Nodularia sp. NIES-3585 TaxID=1973477 RepID=UPI000B5C98B5|nr:hypothetical protein [Nodularia sp. NIES-3585]GAX37210.1 hypothetical protein NIES3585_32520 [Nodularia sp. NIES-3585]
MRPDLQQLYITQEELKTIAGLSNRDIKAYQKLQYPRLSLLLLIGDYVQKILILGWGLIPLGYLIKWKWLRSKQKSILNEVDKYNAVLKAIDIRDQLEAVGNQEAKFQEREQLISTLTTTRNNLIVALRTEQILRKNRTFLARNVQLLESNLTAIQALEIQQEAREYSRLLNEALKISQEVQTEMKYLEGDEEQSHLS